MFSKEFIEFLVPSLKFPGKISKSTSTHKVSVSNKFVEGGWIQHTKLVYPMNL